MRVSNFLLWQIAYSEIWVTETLWPDFRRRRSAGGGRGVPEARTTLRRHQALAGGARRKVNSQHQSSVISSRQPAVARRRQSRVAVVRRVGARSMTRVLSGAVLVALAVAVVRAGAAVSARRRNSAGACLHRILAAGGASGLAIPSVPAGVATIIASLGMTSLRFDLLSTDAAARQPNLDSALLAGFVALAALTLTTWRGERDAVASCVSRDLSDAVSRSSDRCDGRHPCTARSGKRCFC